MPTLGVGGGSEEGFRAVFEVLRGILGVWNRDFWVATIVSLLF